MWAGSEFYCVKLQNLGGCSLTIVIKSYKYNVPYKISFIILKIIIIPYSILIKIWFFGLKLYVIVNFLLFFIGPLHELPPTTPTHFNISLFAPCKPFPVSLFYFFSIMVFFYYVQSSDKYPQSLPFEVLIEKFQCLYFLIHFTLKWSEEFK